MKLQNGLKIYNHTKSLVNALNKIAYTMNIPRSTSILLVNGKHISCMKVNFLILSDTLLFIKYFWLYKLMSTLNKGNFKSANKFNNMTS